MAENQNRPLNERCQLIDARTQIRLLHLNSPNMHDLKFTLTVHDINKPVVNYIAISYVCGTPTPSNSIQLNGKPFPISPNAFYALWQTSQHLPSSISHLWIDSICINQANDAEKSAQVSIMGDIFARAWGVFASLGPHADGSRLLLGHLRSMEELSRGPRFEFDPGIAYQDPKLSLMTKAKMLETLWAPICVRLHIEALDRDAAERLCRAAAALGRRPYWTRLWIVQELRLAKRLQFLFGEDAVEWEMLETATTVLVDNVPLDPPLFMYHRVSHEAYRALGEAPIMRMVKKYTPDEHREQKIGFYIHLSHLQCSDPRDRIYGVLKLVRWPENLPEPFPDYSKRAMDLARDMLDYYDEEGDVFVFADGLLSAFRIDLCRAEVQQFLPKRLFGGSPSSSCRSSTMDVIPKFKPALRLHIDYQDMCIVERDPSGRLRAALCQGSMPKETMLLADGDDKPQVGGQLLFPFFGYPDQPVAILNRSAQPDDILVNLNSMILILRKHGNSYKIFDAGCKIFNYNVCGSKFNCKGCPSLEKKGQVPGSGLDINIDEDDLFVLTKARLLGAQLDPNSADGRKENKRMGEVFAKANFVSYATECPHGDACRRDRIVRWRPAGIGITPG